MGTVAYNYFGMTELFMNHMQMKWNCYIVEKWTFCVPWQVVINDWSTLCPWYKMCYSPKWPHLFLPEFVHVYMEKWAFCTIAHYVLWCILCYSQNGHKKRHIMCTPFLLMVIFWNGQFLKCQHCSSIGSRAKFLIFPRFSCGGRVRYVAVS